MPDQDTPTRVNDNEIEASIRANRYARSVLDPENSPELVRKRYLAEAGQYFFRDRNNALAFEDKGARIATQTEDPVVAASMVELAVAKGWKELKSEEHTSELQSHHDLVCRLLLEKKKKKN